jgi:methyl-accepting chemotaxis protein
MEQLENRVRSLEDGIRTMTHEQTYVKSMYGQFSDTLKELSISFKQISETNIAIQKTIEFLQKDIERNAISQEKMNKKIDDIARFSAEIEKIRDSQNKLEQLTFKETSEIKDDISCLKKEYDEHIKEFRTHEDEGKLDVIQLLKNGAGWLLSIILGVAIIWTLFGQNVRLP